jgi:hypothetical protein
MQGELDFESSSVISRDNTGSAGGLPFLPKEIGYFPPLTRVWAFSAEFCQEEAKIIGSVNGPALAERARLRPSRVKLNVFFKWGQ